MKTWLNRLQIAKFPKFLANVNTEEKRQTEEMLLSVILKYGYPRKKNLPAIMLREKAPG